jgi:hypothetical protein
MWESAREPLRITKGMLARWLGPSDATPVSLRCRIERKFLYRGTTTLDIRALRVLDEAVEVAFYARPIFPNDRRASNMTREAAFAQQLFVDAVTVLESVWSSSERIESIRLSVWVKPIGAEGRERSVLTTHASRHQLDAILDGSRLRRRLAPVEVLCRLSTTTRIDRHGNFQDERAL